MKEITISNEQARRFLLLKNGLIGEYRFVGKQGVIDFINQAGCIQYDPIDVCGKNAELVLQSRIKKFDKQMLYDLLYKDRNLIDYFDKNLAIMNIRDWKYFSRCRDEYNRNGRSSDEVNSISGKIKSIIGERGPVCSGDLSFNDTVSWYWSDTKLSRAALESMYFRGELAIHHKKGTKKYYDLVENCVPYEIISETDPYSDDFEYLKWRVLRRICGVGLLWNKPSDAWLNITGLKANERNKIFNQLLYENKIIEIAVDGIKEKLYCALDDYEILNNVIQNIKLKKRFELLAPLDNMLWDRRMIKCLFNFEYKWEIYTPENQRKYGYYVLPMLFGDKLVGRIELINDKKSKCLIVKNIWLEQGSKMTITLDKQINTCLNRFAAFNNCNSLRRDS